MAVRRDRHHTFPHRCGLPLSFRPPGGLPKQPPTGRSHIVVCPSPSSQCADPGRESHQGQHTGSQPPHRIPGPHSPSWSLA